MKTYQVTIEVTERYTVTVEAESEEEAENTALEADASQRENFDWSPQEVVEVALLSEEDE